MIAEDLLLLVIPVAALVALCGGWWAAYFAGRRRGWIEGWDDAYQSMAELDQAYGRQILELEQRHLELVDDDALIARDDRIVPFHDTARRPP